MLDGNDGRTATADPSGIWEYRARGLHYGTPVIRPPLMDGRRSEDPPEQTQTGKSPSSLSLRWDHLQFWDGWILILDGIFGAHFAFLHARTAAARTHSLSPPLPARTRFHHLPPHLTCCARTFTVMLIATRARA